MFNWMFFFLFFQSSINWRFTLLLSSSKAFMFTIRSRFIFRQIGIWHSMFTTLYYSTRCITSHLFSFTDSSSTSLSFSSMFLFSSLLDPFCNLAVLADIDATITFSLAFLMLSSALCNFALEKGNHYHYRCEFKCYLRANKVIKCHYSREKKVLAQEEGEMKQCVQMLSNKSPQCIRTMTDCFRLFACCVLFFSSFLFFRLQLKWRELKVTKDKDNNNNNNSNRVSKIQ